MKTAILVLLEVLVIIGLSRLMGLVCRYFRQPLVIGEIAAGIMLGPSLLGAIAPDLGAALFPATAVPFLEVLSEVGLIFFMFLIGLELNPKYLKGQFETAILTSHVSIIVPFALGSLLSLLLYPLLSDASVSFTAFALFLGSAMSITAFPVLARIIAEKNLQNTRLGMLALTCAAVDDVTAWCLLALAIAVASTNSMIGAIPTIIGAVVYITLMLTVGSRFLQRLSRYYERTKRINQFVLAGIYMAVLLSALITEVIGIHLIFGAFLMGAIMPKNAGLTRAIAIRTEEFVLIFLLPVFFAYSGLRTQIGLLNNWELWAICALVLGVAIAGKYCGTYVAARFSGLTKRDASVLGWLMNTRGLTELIVLNIGLSLGVITPLLFTMLVIMALTTTFMTSPILEIIYGKRSQPSTEPQEEPQEIDYRVLVPLANPNTRRGLIQLAAAIAPPPAQIYPLSLLEIDEEYLFESMPIEAERSMQERHAQIVQLIDSLEVSAQSIHPITRVCSNVAAETARVVVIEKIDLIITGWHRPTFGKNRLGGRVGQILGTASTNVAVFVDRDRINLNRILVVCVGSIHDDLALEISLRLLINKKDIHLQIMSIGQNPDLSPKLNEFLAQLPSTICDRIKILPRISQDESNETTQLIAATQDVDLVVVGASRKWGLERLGEYAESLISECPASVLVTRKYSNSSNLTSFLASIQEVHDESEVES
jgi:Kef-type K+ transport system membrane component KefB